MSAPPDDGELGLAICTGDSVTLDPASSDGEYQHKGDETTDFIQGRTGESWLREEVNVVVAAYLAMLAAEIRGERLQKAAMVRDLIGVLPARSPGSIERKMQNISAVLDELGLEWIDGYKPLPHYQRELRTAVMDVLGRDRRASETMAEYRDNVLAAPMPKQLSTDDVLVEPPSVSKRPRTTHIGLTTGSIGALMDFQNRRLGRNGEEWVVGIEREQLSRSGRGDLADKVEWTARDVGDGAGYDITSFRLDGSPLLIEVKTTNLGMRTPFHITSWEVEVSRKRPDDYSLYRVFDFRSDPRVYKLDGSVEESARLVPSVFLGLPR